MSKDVVTLEKANDAVEVNFLDIVNNDEFLKTGIYIHKFKTPFTCEGKTYETLTFDYNKLTGRDMMNISNEMTMNNEVMMAMEISLGFQTRMASKASGVGLDIIEKMPMKDVAEFVSKARLFLLSTEL